VSVHPTSTLLRRRKSAGQVAVRSCFWLPWRSVACRVGCPPWTAVSIPVKAQDSQVEAEGAARPGRGADLNPPRAALLSRAGDLAPAGDQTDLGSALPGTKIRHGTAPRRRRYAGILNELSPTGPGAARRGLSLCALPARLPGVRPDPECEPCLHIVNAGQRERLGQSDAGERRSGNQTAELARSAAAMAESKRKHGLLPVRLPSED
jgi:hypothetical protein